MRILFVDEDKEYIGGFLSDIQKEYVVDVAYNAEEGSYLCEVNDYDTVIVNEALPDGSGKEICQKARNLGSRSPIVIISEKYDYRRVLEHLNYGADLSLPKSIKSSDLVIGVRALIKRTYGSGNKLIQVKNLSLDAENKCVYVKNRLIELRRKEYDILEYLMINKGYTASKEKLLEHIWVPGIYVLSNTVEVHIRNLRARIEKPFRVKIIRTIRGYGYRID